MGPKSILLVDQSAVKARFEVPYYYKRSFALEFSYDLLQFIKMGLPFFFLPSIEGNMRANNDNFV